MSRTLLEEIGRAVEQACVADTNVFGYGIWTHHIQQVADHARRLAPRFGADPEIAEVAALLHDYASVKDEALYEDHHVHGPAEAAKVLSRLDVPQTKIEAVQEAIAGHRASVPVGERSAEAECLANADALAHIEQVPSLLFLAFQQHGLGIDDGAAWVRAKLTRSWNKLRPDVQEMVRDRYEAALKTLSSSSSR